MEFDTDTRLVGRGCKFEAKIAGEWLGGCEIREELSAQCSCCSCDSWDASRCFSPDAAETLLLSQDGGINSSSSSWLLNTASVGTTWACCWRDSVECAVEHDGCVSAAKSRRLIKVLRTIALGTLLSGELIVSDELCD